MNAARLAPLDVDSLDPAGVAEGVDCFDFLMLSGFAGGRICRLAGVEL